MRIHGMVEPVRKRQFPIVGDGGASNARARRVLG
jgi:hypothetical protein